MNTAMFILPPHRIRSVLAIGFLIAAGPALAEEDFSEHWILERELEMTRELAADIEADIVASMNRNVATRLARFDWPRARNAAAPPAAAAPRDAAADHGTAVAERSRMSCSADPDHSFACTVRPAR